MLGMLSNAGLVALFSMLVGVLPIGFGLAYAVRHTEQRLALLQVYQRVPGSAAPREFLQQLVALIGSIIRAKAAVAGKHRGAWVLAAESQPDPALSISANGGAQDLDLEVFFRAEVRE